jgi:hypothetical protein
MYQSDSLFSLSVWDKNCRVTVTSWSNGIFTRICHVLTWSRKHKHKPIEINIWDSLRSVDCVTLQSNWNHEPCVNEVESSVLPEVISLVVLGLFSPQCIDWKWVDIREKEQMFSMSRKINERQAFGKQYWRQIMHLQYLYSYQLLESEVKFSLINILLKERYFAVG